MLKKFKEWYARINTLVSSQNYLSKRINLDDGAFTIKTGESLTVLVAQLAHVDALVSLQRLAYNGSVPWHRSALVKDMTTNPCALYVVAMNKQTAVGFIGTWMLKNEAHITNICVAPTYQGCGIGSKLIEIMEEIAIAENMTEYTLEVRVSNTDAYRLYQQIGFKEMGIKRNYYLDNGEDAIDMRKELPHSPIDEMSVTDGE